MGLNLVPVYSIETSSCFFGTSTPFPRLSMIFSTPIVMWKGRFGLVCSRVIQVDSSKMLLISRNCVYSGSVMRNIVDVLGSDKKFELERPNGNRRRRAFNSGEALLNVEQRLRGCRLAEGLSRKVQLLCNKMGFLATALVS